MSGVELVQFHLGRSTHPFYHEQAMHAPAGFRYRLTEAGKRTDAPPAPRRIAQAGSRLSSVRTGAEWVATRTLARGGYIRRTAIEGVSGARLIHSAQILLKRPPLPYVLDFECIEAFTLYQRQTLKRPWARAQLLDHLLDDACRRLLPWSEAARRGLTTAWGSRRAELEAKTVTVLPAIRPRTDRPRARERGALRILFVGTAFYGKGGVEAIEAVKRARQNHEIVLDMVSDVPALWRQRVERSPFITIHRWPVATSLLNELFKTADLLLFPSHMDTLGYVILEAMAHGMPVIASGHFAVPELIEHETSGLVVSPENVLYGADGLCRFDRTLPPPASFRSALRAPSEHYVGTIATALDRIAGDEALHTHLAEGAFARVTKGPLSRGYRARVLGRIYRESLA